MSEAAVRDFTPAVSVSVIQKDVTILGDCMNVMPRFPDHCFDMIICDPPYGVTDHDWDKIIPPDKMWQQFCGLIKPNGAIVLFYQQPFTTDLINSNRKMFRYPLAWVKNLATGHLNAKIQPLRKHEDILVIYKSKPYYCAQKTLVSNVSGNGLTDRYLVTVLTFAKDSPNLHPTQKPLGLAQQLIETYTRPGELVIDCCAGCGTTGLAAKIVRRHFVQIERELSYYKIAEKRSGEL